MPTINTVPKTLFVKSKMFFFAILKTCTKSIALRGGNSSKKKLSLVGKKVLFNMVDKINATIKPSKYNPETTKNARLPKNADASKMKTGSLAIQLIYGLIKAVFIFMFLFGMFRVAIVDIVLQPRPSNIVYIAFPFKPTLENKSSTRYDNLAINPLSSKIVKNTKSKHTCGTNPNTVEIEDKTPFEMNSINQILSLIVQIKFTIGFTIKKLNNFSKISEKNATNKKKIK